MTSRPARPSRRSFALAASPLALAVALGAVPVPLEAGPKGGQVQRGEARISTRGAVTTIRQGGQKVVIDWRSFDVDADEAVRFLQPNRRAVALNRILDATPTHIRGRLSANGNVWIVNRHGVIFHSTSMVDVGGLLASTADITDDDFMAGRYRFGIPGAPGARIVNKGDITVAEAGLVGLVGPHAANRGSITARLGKVVVAGAETYALDLAGDGLMAFQFDPAAAGVSAEQAGEIIAAGGAVEIGVAVADALVDASVSVKGLVDAGDPAGDGGSVVITAPSGSVEVAGEVAASGGAGDGGSIDVRAAEVTVTEPARITATGSATGGDVVVFGTETLAFSGAADATGGLKGGFVETSGAEISFAGTVHVGPGGLWLIDPGDVTIDDTLAAGTVNNFRPQDFLPTVVAGGSFAIVATVQAAPPEDGNITVVNGLSAVDMDTGASGTLSLDAAGAVIFAPGSGGIAQVGGDDGALNLSITAGSGTGGIQQNGEPLSLAATQPTTLTLIAGAAEALPTFTASALDLTVSGDVTIDTQPGATYDSADLTPLLLAGTDVSVTATAAGADDGDLTVLRGLNAIQVGAGLSAALSLSAANALTLADAPPPQAAQDGIGQDTTGGASGTLSVSLVAGGSAAGALTLDRPIALGAGSTLTLSAPGALDLPAITTGTLFATAVGNVDDSGDLAVGSASVTAGASGADATITLDRAANDFDTLSAVAQDDAVVLVDADGVALGPVTASDLTLNAGGAVTSGGAIVAPTAQITATGAAAPVTLDDTGNDFGALGVTAAGDAVTVADANAIDLAGITAGSLTITAGGNVTDSVASAVGGLTRVTAGGPGPDASVTLDVATNAFGAFAASAPGDAVTVADANAIDLAGVTAASLTVTAGGNVTDSAASTVTGLTTITAGGAGPDAAVTLDVGASDFGTIAVTAPGDAVTVADANAIDLAGVTAASLTVTADGNVTDSAASTVTGLTTITAGGAGADAAVTLDLATNAFGTVAVTAQDDAVIVADTDALDLGGVTAASLTITAGGSVTDSAASTVTGLTTVTAGGAGPDAAVTLDVAANAFGTVAVTAQDDAVSIRDAGTVSLADITAGSLQVLAGTGGGAAGTITQSGTALAIGGAASFSTVGDGSISLPGASNAFGTLALDANAGDALARETNATTLGDVQAGRFVLRSAGPITQSVGAVVEAGIAEVTGFGGAAQTVDLSFSANDFDSLSVIGSTVTVSDANTLFLVSSRATTALTVNAAGGLTLRQVSVGDDAPLVGQTLTAEGAFVVGFSPNFALVPNITLGALFYL